MAADSVLQSSVDSYIAQVSEKDMTDDDILYDFYVQDHTDRTNSVVITLSDYDIYDTVKNYLTENYDYNILKSCDGIIYKTLHCNLNVIVTAYNSTKRLHIQGRGCKIWWNDVFIFIVEDLIEKSKQQWPITSTPSPCCTNSMTELKQIATNESYVNNDTLSNDIAAIENCANSMTVPKQIAVTKGYSANTDHSTMKSDLITNSVNHQLSSCCTMQSRMDQLEESNKSYIIQISSNADALNRAKEKLRSFINNNKSLTNDSVQVNTDLNEENTLLKEQITHMRAMLATNRSDIKLLAQERKNLTESLRQANEQCEEQVALLSALMDQLTQTNQPKAQQPKMKRKESQQQPIPTKQSHANMPETPSRHDDKVKTTHTGTAIPKPTTDVRPDPVSTAPAVKQTCRSGKTLIIGSSILKLVNKRGLSGDVDVKCIRGGIVPDIGLALLNMDLSTYDTIVVHVGGNDASQGQCVSDIIYEYQRLLNVVFSHNPDINVIVSELTPRKDVDVRSVNTALKEFCNQCSVSFVEQYATTECQTKFIHWDGIHLTKYGTAHLLKNINAVTSILKDGVNAKRYSSMNNDPLCYYCGETGHVTKVCRHGSPVRCWKCGVTGHKSKMCQDAIQF